MKLLFALSFALFSTIINATTIDFAVSWSPGNTCSIMCDAFRRQASGYCQVKGFAGGSATSCNCYEGEDPSTAYGKLECSGEMPKGEVALELSVRLSGEQCSAASSHFDEKVKNFCIGEKYTSGSRITPVFCDEGKFQRGWAIVRCVK